MQLLMMHFQTSSSNDLSQGSGSVEGAVPVGTDAKFYFYNEASPKPQRP